MRILIIDDSNDFRALCRLYLSGMEDVEFIEYDFDALGKPPENYDWSRYDILLLDYKLGPNEDGLLWLKEFRDKPNFPPTIILTAEGDEYVAVKSMKLGAADYINKTDVTPKRIVKMVQDVTNDFAKQSDAKRQDEINEASRILRKTLKKDTLLGSGADIGYKFVRMIGQGAMSKVYLAERIQDNLTVVLKILDLTRTRAPRLLQRFIQEATLIADLNSPYVAKIYEHGRTKEYGYIVMEFFARGDLKQRCEMNLDPETVLNYVIHIAHGLEQIHAVNIVHRDLKPANIMFRGDDSLALVDFGISKSIGGISEAMTTLGQILGTPFYMSPEQGEGMEVDTRADLYSLGVIFYELLTGEKPFRAATAEALIYQHIHAPIPKLPDSLIHYQSIIAGLLAKRVDDRIQTARELISRLKSFQ